MKKVLHIVISENYQEGESYHHNVLSQKHKCMGYDVYVIAKQSYKDRDGNEFFLQPGKYTNKHGITVYLLPCTKHNPRYQMIYDMCEGLYETIYEIKPDIIFTHNFTSPDVKYIIRYAKQHPEVKVFADCHSDYFNSPVNSLWSRINSFFIRGNARRLNKVVVKFWGTTPWRVDYLKDIYKVPANKVDLLIMGASEELIVGRDIVKVRNSVREKYNIPNDAFLITTGGKLDKRKNQIVLLEAVKELANENVWLIVFGTPTQEMQPEFARFSGVKNVIQTGWLPSEGAYDLFLASDLACFPGTHSVLWEQAAACGIPVAVKHWSGMEHINVNGNAFFLEETDTAAIKKSLLRIKNVEYAQLKRNAVICAPSFFAIKNAQKAIGEE